MTVPCFLQFFLFSYLNLILGLGNMAKKIKGSYVLTKIWCA